MKVLYHPLLLQQRLSSIRVGLRSIIILRFWARNIRESKVHLRVQVVDVFDESPILQFQRITKRCLLFFTLLCSLRTIRIKLVTLFLLSDWRASGEWKHSPIFHLVFELLLLVASCMDTFHEHRSPRVVQRVCFVVHHSGHQLFYVSFEFTWVLRIRLIRIVFGSVNHFQVERFIPVCLDCVFLV